MANLWKIIRLKLIKNINQVCLNWTVATVISFGTEKKILQLILIKFNMISKQRLTIRYLHDIRNRNFVQLLVKSNISEVKWNVIW